MLNSYFKDGRIFADELSRTEITQSKQLVTKEYVDYEITNASSGSGSGTYNIGDEYMGGIVFHTWDLYKHVYQLHISTLVRFRALNSFS